jgi:hypothetical protein
MRWTCGKGYVCGLPGGSAVMAQSRARALVAGAPPCWSAGRVTSFPPS